MARGNWRLSSSRVIRQYIKALDGHAGHPWSVGLVLALTCSTCNGGGWAVEDEYLALLIVTSSIHVVVRVLEPLSTATIGPFSTVAKYRWPSAKE